MHLQDQFQAHLKKKIHGHFQFFQFQQGLSWERLIYEDESVLEKINFFGNLEKNFASRETPYNCRGRIYSSRKIKLIEDFWEDLADEIKFQAQNNATVVAEAYDRMSQKHQTRYDFPFTNNFEADSTKAANHLIDEYHQRLFPMLEQQSDIRYLQQYYNDPIETKGYQGKGWFLKLIIAKLAGAENYAQIRDFVYAHFSKAIAKPEYPEDQRNKYRNWLEALETVHQRLQSVEPLKDPYLGSPKRRQMEEEWRALNR